ncbi:MAG: prolyl oligopeptidase family serine peptidase [Chloroflexota bacterium]
MIDPVEGPLRRASGAGAWVRPRLALLLACLLLAATGVPVALAASPAPAPPPSDLQVVHRSGQTFLTWTEVPGITRERYRIYRADAPIVDPESDATLIGVVGEGSSRLWSERVQVDGTWQPRTGIDHVAVPRPDPELGPDEGVFVWTPDRADLGGDGSGRAWYAVVTEDRTGYRSAPALTGPVAERVGTPRPILAGTLQGGLVRQQITWMDLHEWNPTFDAPGPANDFLGLPPDMPGVRDALAYAYLSVIALPGPDDCPDRIVPRVLPVAIRLHGRTGATLPPNLDSAGRCWIEIRLTDPRDTAWFGFGETTDYRTTDRPDPDDRIASFTEARVMQAVHDLLRDPELSARVDPQRVYVFGGSMGGTGTLALALRYPNVFAQAYAWIPVTDWSDPDLGTDPAGVLAAWGPPNENLPIHLVGDPADLAMIRDDEGEGVWSHEDLVRALVKHPEREAVPFGVAVGRLDDVATFRSQGAPLFPALEGAQRAYSGVILDTGHHDLSWEGLPPTLGTINGSPFRQLRAIRDETVPGIAEPSSIDDWPPTTPRGIHDQIAWSASWWPWAGAPVDEPARWSMALRSLDGSAHAITVTPRRLQRFQVDEGATYAWSVRGLGDGTVVDQGITIADPGGLLAVPVTVTPGGVRVEIVPAGG